MEANELTLQALDLNQQASVLFKSGNVEEALAKVNEAIDKDPMVIESYKNLGDMNLALENYEEAKAGYKKALLIEKRGDIYFQYGNACFMNDEPHEGLEQYNRAIAAGFDNDEMLFFMGMAYEHMNDDKMALRYITKAVTKNPSRPDFKVKKISVQLRLNMIDEAKADIEDLLLNDPELYDGYHMKTAVLVEEGDFEAAAAFAKTAADRFPEDADLMYDYANTTALAGDLDGAIKLIENAKQMKFFEDAKAKFTFLEAEVNAEQGNMDEAIQYCQECIALEQEGECFAEARFMLINLAMTKPDFELALAQADALIANGAKDSYYFAALYYKPFCLRKMGKEAEAVENFKEAISFYRMATLQNPEAFDAYMYRAMALKDIEDYEAALTLLEFMENLDSDIAEIYTIRADIYKLTGKEALAKEALEKAFSIKPELREAFGEGK